MNNVQVSNDLREIAELLELKGESSFRIRAYENAARAIDALPQDINVLAAEGELKDIPGIGAGIAQRIDELLATGHTRYLDELRREFPPGVRRLLSVPGVGPTLARRVYRELGVEDLAGLRQVAEDGRLAALKGLGEKSAENVLRGLARTNKEETRLSIGTALPLAEEFVAALREHPFIHQLIPAGSLRRWAPTIGDIDIMATSDEPERAMDAFVHLPQVADILGHGPTKSSIVARNRLQVDLRIVPAAGFGALLQHFTGSREHNIQLREYALRQGFSLNEYGITTLATGQRQTFATEEAFYHALGLEWIPPELRQGSGEVEAARERRLPRLVTVADIHGELHAHTDWSDGSMTIEQMALGARARGYQYLAITDHSPSVGVAGGLSPDRVLAQIERIHRLDAEMEGITLLAGAEVDIKRDGTLDYPDELLAQLDWVIASVHSGFNQPEAQMTNRLIRAMENPYVRAIGHPTGGLIGKRAPYAVDLEAVFRAAARTRTALEINAQPSRLDLVDTQARRAIELGVTLVINTDAHAATQFEFLRYGVEMARRGWAEADNVLNARDLTALRAWLNSSGP